MHLLMEILLVILKILYYICENLYQWFIPVEKKSVAGEIVLITGAGEGIGKELAKGYGLLGATVICWDRNTETNERTMNEIKKMGGSAYAYTCDVSDPEEVFNVMDKVQKEVGNVTILINNAGVAPVRKFLDYSIKEIARVINVNLMAHYWTLKAFLPNMVERNHGHIVTISSIASFWRSCHGTTYCPSKHAVTALTDSLRLEFDTYSKGNSLIKFTAIYPSFVNTKLIRKPNFRFPNIIKLQSPHEIAAAIIDAQRRNLKEISLPSWMLPVLKIMRFLPYKAFDCIQNFLGINVEADDPSEIYI